MARWILMAMPVSEAMTILDAVDLTYPEVGATRSRRVVSDGYIFSRQSRDLGSGQETFVRTIEALRSLAMHRRAGLRVRGVQRVEDGAEVAFGFGVDPAAEF